MRRFMTFVLLLVAMGGAAVADTIIEYKLPLMSIPDNPLTVPGFKNDILQVKAGMSLEVARKILKEQGFVEKESEVLSGIWEKPDQNGMLKVRDGLYIKLTGGDPSYVRNIRFEKEEQDVVRSVSLHFVSKFWGNKLDSISYSMSFKGTLPVEKFKQALLEKYGEPSCWEDREKKPIWFYNEDGVRKLKDCNNANPDEEISISAYNDEWNRGHLTSARIILEGGRLHRETLAHDDSYYYIKNFIRETVRKLDEVQNAPKL